MSQLHEKALKAKRLEIAEKALEGVVGAMMGAAQPFDPREISRRAFEVADAVIAEAGLGSGSGGGLTR